MQVHARNKPLDRSNDDALLRTIADLAIGYSGAELANLLNEGAILAVRAELASLQAQLRRRRHCFPVCSSRDTRPRWPLSTLVLRLPAFLFARMLARMPARLQVRQNKSEIDLPILKEAMDKVGPVCWGLLHWLAAACWRSFLGTVGDCCWGLLGPACRGRLGPLKPG